MKVFEILRTKQIQGDVGVEIEVEGENLGEPARGSNWEMKADGSLRNGMEYVYKKALPIDGIEKSLDEINVFMKNSRLDFSFRTSVHVHVNCHDLEYDQLLNFVYASVLLDSVLVNYCGESRKANRFCLRLADAEGLIDSISPLFESRNAPKASFDVLIPRNTVRYAAVNVESLGKFGTIEFRSMRGTIDKNILLPWIKGLVNIREYARKFDSPQEIFHDITNYGFQAFAQNALGESFPVFNYPMLEQDIGLNLSLAIDLPHIAHVKIEKLNKVYKFAGGEWESNNLKEVIGRNPKRMYLRELIPQGICEDPLFITYFEWEDCANLLQEMMDYPGVRDIYERFIGDPDEIDEDFE